MVLKKGNFNGNETSTTYFLPNDYISSYLLECIDNQIIEEDEDQVARFVLDKNRFDTMVFVKSIHAASDQ